MWCWREKGLFGSRNLGKGTLCNPCRLPSPDRLRTDSGPTPSTDSVDSVVRDRLPFDLYLGRLPQCWGIRPALYLHRCSRFRFFFFFCRVASLTVLEVLKCVETHTTLFQLTNMGKNMEEPFGSPPPHHLRLFDSFFSLSGKKCPMGQTWGRCFGHLPRLIYKAIMVFSFLRGSCTFWKMNTLPCTCYFIVYNIFSW